MAVMYAIQVRFAAHPAAVVQPVGSQQARVIFLTSMTHQ